MSETKAPTAETEQEAETGAAKPNTPDLPEKNSEPGKTNPSETEYTGEDTGSKTRQRFFSQTEVNRIVKREIERSLKTSKLPNSKPRRPRLPSLKRSFANANCASW